MPAVYLGHCYSMKISFYSEMGPLLLSHCASPSTTDSGGSTVAHPTLYGLTKSEGLL